MKVKSYIPLLVLSVILVACFNAKTVTDTTGTDRPVTNQQTSIGVLGDEDSLPEMPLVGIALNLKGGAVVESGGVHYWVEDLYAWDERYLNNPVKVWGTIEIRYDAPVIRDTSSTVSQGIPVESEQEYQRQSKRYWIVDATFDLLKP